VTVASGGKNDLRFDIYTFPLFFVTTASNHLTQWLWTSIIWQ